MNTILKAVVGMLALSFFVACKNKDKVLNENDGIYLDYKIIGEEGNDNLVITAQFRDGSPGADALELKQPGSILLDGQPLVADSSKYSGYIYETYRAIDSFAGSHLFIYTNPEGLKRETAFNFRAPQLTTALPDTLQRKDLMLAFSGLEENASIRVTLIDTSFANEGLNSVETIENGSLLLSAESLETVENGPVQLELELESEKPLGTKREGRVLILYKLRRELFLVD